MHLESHALICPDSIQQAFRAGLFTSPFAFSQLLRRAKVDKSILLDAVTDRLTKAFAELIHLKMRKELWGHAPDEDLSLDDLLKVTKDDGERDSFRRREIYRFSV